MKSNCEIENKPKNLKDFLKSAVFRKSLIGVIAGALLGYLYYHYVGCTSGSCAITGNPFSSTAAGGFFGYFIVNSPCRTC